MMKFRELSGNTRKVVSNIVNGIGLKGIAIIVGFLTTPAYMKYFEDNADKLQGKDRDILNLRPGITGPASLKYRDEEYMIASFVEYILHGKKLSPKISIPKELPDFTGQSAECIAKWYNDNVIYPDKVRLNYFYYHNYSFIKDIQMIFATILGKRIQYAGEII